MREVHGVAGVQRLPFSTCYEQRVLVTDEADCVRLTHTADEPAGMTPDEARLVAAQLIASADRVEAAIAAKAAAEPTKVTPIKSAKK